MDDKETIQETRSAIRPFHLRTGSKFVGNLFRLVKVKGRKPATCSIADINSIGISW